MAAGPPRGKEKRRGNRRVEAASPAVIGNLFALERALDQGERIG
jgi:hypothetical protein